ncbi:uncharacterized protein LOC105385699 [Plutella xylostella]|uniref:uncharacterized protein LOC105385699 n=1 Tax=Plutella xylostella TaxID=51655 RepID=UPI002032E88C|nr:uncharacterized protein LOC105385699 [Plutella xylostella]
MAANAAIIAIHIIFIITLTHQTERKEEGYLRKVKDACYLHGEALSCVKYKAIKLAKNAIFPKVTNETIRASHMISFVPLDEETIRKFDAQDVSLNVSEGRGLLSEWSELTKYIVKVVKDFFKTKGLRVALPDGARAIEDDVEEEGRGKRKKLALVIPFLTLMAVLKAKLLLLPILLAVLLIKKLLLAAALLIPSLLHTLKACKVHHAPMHSYFGSADTSDFSTGYSNNFVSSSGYPKDWASNRAYALSKPRVTPQPGYVTAPGGMA